jgi:hypothetical protein
MELKGGFPLAKQEEEDRDNKFMDIDRMVNEGLGGGNVTMHNGLIDESTTDSMVDETSVVEE